MPAAVSRLAHSARRLRGRLVERTTAENPKAASKSGKADAKTQTQAKNPGQPKPEAPASADRGTQTPRWRCEDPGESLPVSRGQEVSSSHVENSREGQLCAASGPSGIMRLPYHVLHIIGDFVSTKDMPPGSLALVYDLSEASLWDFSGCYPKLTKKDVRVLVRAVATNEAIEELILGAGNYIGNAGAEALAEVLPCTLQILNLASTGIQVSGAAALADALMSNTVLRILDLRGNCIGDLGAGAIMRPLANNHCVLEELNLAVNEIVGDCALAEALMTNTTLRRLSLSRNLMQCVWVNGLLSALQCNSMLQELNLSGNNTDLTAATSLESALTANIALQKLDLRGNYLGDEGAQALAKALRTNSTLRDLNLAGARIGHDGAAALADALMCNSTLRRLNLGQNAPISDPGAGAFAKALVWNAALEDLNLGGNGISDVGAEALADALISNTTLLQLDLSGNEISDAGAEALADTLISNSKLWKLNIWGNKICEDTIAAVTLLLEHRTPCRPAS